MVTGSTFPSWYVLRKFQHSPRRALINVWATSGRRKASLINRFRTCARKVTDSRTWQFTICRTSYAAWFTFQGWYLHGLKIRLITPEERPIAARMMASGMAENPIHVAVQGPNLRARQRRLELIFPPIRVLTRHLHRCSP